MCKKLSQWFSSRSPEFWAKDIHSLIKRFNKCVNFQIDYVEKYIIVLFFREKFYSEKESCQINIHCTFLLSNSFTYFVIFKLQLLLCARCSGIFILHIYIYQTLNFQIKSVNIKINNMYFYCILLFFLTVPHAERVVNKSYNCVGRTIKLV
jgi:hypothetical protein